MAKWLRLMSCELVAWCTKRSRLRTRLLVLGVMVPWGKRYHLRVYLGGDAGMAGALKWGKGVW